MMPRGRTGRPGGGALAFIARSLAFSLGVMIGLGVLALIVAAYG